MNSLPPPAGLALVCPSEQCGGRPREDLEIDPRRAVLDVPDVELDAFVPRQPRTSVNLSPAGDAGLDVEASPLSRRVLLDLVRERGARADEAHVAADDIPELRDLVERQSPQRTTDPRDAWIALVHGVARSFTLGPDSHRAQLDELEVSAAQADSALPIEDRAPVVELDRNSGRRECGAGNRQPESRERRIDEAVHRVPSAFAHTAGTPKRRYRTSDTTVAQVTST